MENYTGTIIVVLLFVVHWTASIIVQTIFLHRYAAHNLLRFTSPLMEYGALVITWIALGPSYLSPIAYGKMHNIHHMDPDGPLDPHKPEKGIIGFLKTMWRTAVVYRRFENGTDYRIPMVDLKRIPNLEHLRPLDSVMQNWIVRIVWILAYVSAYIWIDNQFGFQAFWYILLLGHISMGPIHGAMVNYFAHIWGERPHKMKNTSTNLVPNWLVRFLLWGENEHNEHHFDPESIKFGKGDLGFGLIKMLAGLGILEIRQSPTSN